MIDSLLENYGVADTVISSSLMLIEATEDVHAISDGLGSYLMC